MKSEQWDTPNFYFGVGVGQCIAFVDAVGGSMAELLGDRSLPMFMATCCYALLATIYGGYLLRRQGWHLQAAWWKYALLSLNDAAAAYFTLLALRYTSVTSWALIQPASMISVVPLSMFMLRAKYTWKHLLSGLLAFGGLVLLLLSDVGGGDSNDDHSALTTLLGDFCILLGANLYGINTVMVETVVKGKIPQYEVLGMMGVFGFFYGLIASLCLGEISPHMFPKSTVALYMFLSAGANFMFYSLGIVVLKNAGSATLEISLLGVNFWSVLGKLFIIGGFHTHLIGFIFALLMVVSGVTFFTLSGDPYASNTHPYTILETELPSTRTEPQTPSQTTVQ